MLFLVEITLLLRAKLIKTSLKYANNININLIF